jgi:hypothetical protein
VVTEESFDRKRFIFGRCWGILCFVVFAGAEQVFDGNGFVLDRYRLRVFGGGFSSPLGFYRRTTLLLGSLTFAFSSLGSETLSLSGLAFTLGLFGSLAFTLGCFGGQALPLGLFGSLAFTLGCFGGQALPLGLFFGSLTLTFGGLGGEVLPFGLLGSRLFALGLFDSRSLTLGCFGGQTLLLGLLRGQALAFSGLPLGFSSRRSFLSKSFLFSVFRCLALTLCTGSRLLLAALGLVLELLLEGGDGLRAEETLDAPGRVGPLQVDVAHPAARGQAAGVDQVPQLGNGEGAFLLAVFHEVEELTEFAGIPGCSGVPLGRRWCGGRGRSGATFLGEQAPQATGGNGFIHIMPPDRGFRLHAAICGEFLELRLGKGATLIPARGRHIEFIGHRRSLPAQFGTIITVRGTSDGDE